MSFMGNLKHTLSIGVRVTTDDASRGFRQMAQQHDAAVAQMQSKIRGLNTDVSKMREANDAASRAATQATAAQNKIIREQERAQRLLNDEIKKHKERLKEAQDQAPKGDAAYSKKYREAVQFNRTLDEQINKQKELIRLEQTAGRAATTAQRAAVRDVLPKSQQELAQIRLRQEAANARLKDLRAMDAADAARKRLPKDYVRDMAALEASAVNVRDLSAAKAKIDADIRGAAVLVTAGRRGSEALRLGVADEAANKARFEEITARQKAGQITKGQATQERLALRTQGIFQSMEEAQKFTATANLKAQPLKIESEKLKRQLETEREKVTRVQARLEGSSTLTQAQRDRVRERVALQQESADLAFTALGLKGNISAERQRLTTNFNDAQQQRAQRISAAEAEAARLEATRKVVPDKGMSQEATRHNMRQGMILAQIDRATKALASAGEAIFGARGEKDKIKAEFAREVTERQKLINAKVAETQEAMRLRDAQKNLAIEAREAARALRSQLIGAITQSVASLAMTFQAIKTILNATRSAENFEFSARSVSALLGERRPAGEVLYNQYLAKYGATQGEVMPVAAIERMKQLAAAGYSKSSMVENTAAIFDVMLASAGELTEQSAADLGISLERAFGSLRMDMRAALDTAVKAANQFPMTVGNIRDALGYATEAAVQSGQSLEETLLVIGSIMPIAKTASKAGTITRNALLSLVKPESQKILSELGVRPVDAEGKRRPMMDVFLDLNDQLKEVAKGKSSKYYRSPERIAEEKAAAKAAGVKYEPKSLDKVFKQQLGLEREQLEFRLTGVRGGAIFAAVNRMVETTMEKTKGTAFEGMRAADARTAFEFLRIGLSGAAGEASRLAGELRRTSKMLGESFDASLERFKIALGTAALPMKDAFLAVAKSLLDKMTNMVTPNPGVGAAYTPGSSVGLNAVGTFGGIAAAGATGYGVYQVGKALFQAKAIIGTVSASMATTTAASGSLAGAFSGLVSFLTGPAGIAIALASAAAAVFSFQTGVDAAYKAVTDFSDYLDRQNKARTQKEERALGAMFEALAAGKLGIGASGQVTGLNRGQMFDIAEAGPLAASVARFIAGGGDPTKAGEFYNEARRQVVAKQYAGSPELPAQLEALKVDEKRIIEEVMPKLLRTLFTSPDYKETKGDRGTFGLDQLHSAYQITKLNRAQRGYAPFASEFPTGGAEVDLRRNFMEQQGAKTMDEAMANASFLNKLSFRQQLYNVPLNERLRPNTEEGVQNLLQEKRYQLAGTSANRQLMKMLFFGDFKGVSLSSDQEKQVLEYEQKLRGRPAAFTSMSQLDEQGRYNPAISAEARYKNPAIEAFLTAAGDGQKSMVRIPGFVEEIKVILAKAATEKGQEKLEQSISRLNFPPINPMPSMVLEPEPNN
jgi:hypothetical protein